MENLGLASVLTESGLLVGLRCVISFLIFYISFSNFLLLLALYNNWGRPINLKIGMRGAEIEVAQPPKAAHDAKGKGAELEERSKPR
jgi:hypothetical protein